MFKAFAPTAFDFYKSDHIHQYIEGTSMVYANFTPRSDRYFTDYMSDAVKNYWDGKVVAFGMQAVAQAFMIDEFNASFFSQNEDDAVDYFMRRMDTSLGPNGIGGEHIRALHRLGFLPIRVKALAEGSNVNIKVPVFTVMSTIDEFYWVTNSLESVLSNLSWKAMTSATIAKMYRKILMHWAEKTGSPFDFVDWQGHDFSFRGMSGIDDAMMSGAGHLLSFTGTDTVPAIEFLERFYGADAEKELIGGSVNATEHSVTSLSIMKVLRELQKGEGYKGQTVAEIWGEGHETVDLRLVAELLVIKRLITEVYPTGVFSYVADTYDFWAVITQIAPRLKDVIMARDGKVVFRPDSGDHVKIVTGYRVVILDEEYSGSEAIIRNGKFYSVVPTEENREGFKPGEEIPDCEIDGAIHCLYRTFGGTETSTGHIILDSHVGLIYGDSITLDREELILRRLARKNFASANIVFGIGSFTYERQTRDTFGFAVKATAAIVDGELLEIYKDPKTDGGTKKSAKGLLRVEKEGNDFVLYDQQTWEQEAEGALETVFLNGKLVKFQTLAEIRGRLRNAN